MPAPRSIARLLAVAFIAAWGAGGAPPIATAQTPADTRAPTLRMTPERPGSLQRRAARRAPGARRVSASLDARGHARGATPPASIGATAPPRALLAEGRLLRVDRATFTGDGVVVHTVEGRRAGVAFGDLDALLLGAAAPPPEALTAHFHDGRRISGALRFDGGGPALDHPALGRFPLAGAARLTLDHIEDAAPLDGAGVVLRNGDTIEGGCALLPDGVRVQRRDMETMVIPLERVASIRFDAPATTPVSFALLAHLADGAVVAARSVASDAKGGLLDLTLLDGRVVRLAHESLTGLTRPGVSLTPIASETLEPSRGVMLARAGSHAIDTPAGAIAVRGVVSMPESALPWGETLVTVWSGGAPVHFTRLDAARPAAGFLLPLRGGVTLTIASGAGGEANAVARVEGAFISLTRPSSAGGAQP